MRFKILNCFTAIALFALLTLSPHVAAQEQDIQGAVRYGVTDLGTLGGTTSVALGVNDKGWVTGNSNLPDDTAGHAFLWQEGMKTDLGALGGPNSRTQAISMAGWIVGGADSSISDPMGEDFCFLGTQLVCLPFLWQNGAMTGLPTLGGNNGIAQGINNRGQAAGVAENSILDPTCASSEFQAKPVIWDKAGAHQLPITSGDPDGSVSGINNQGKAVGASGDCWAGSAFALHALLWQNGSVRDLGSFGGTLLSLASAVNDQGQVAGFTDLTGDTNFFAGFPGVNAHAFLWQSGVMNDLGTLSGDASSFAFGINNRGQVVGAGSRAILWQNGSITDLNALVPGPPFSPLYLLQALGINDQGEIVGYGLTSNGDIHAFLAVPCDQNHADRDACTHSGVLQVVDTSPTSGVSGKLTKGTRMNPAFGARFGGMRERPWITPFAANFLLGPRSATTHSSNVSPTPNGTR